MMKMDETHKKVIELSGFEVLSQVVEPNDEYVDGTRYALVYGGKEYHYGEVFEFKPDSFDNYNCETEDEAWAQAPSLEALMLPLMEAFRQAGCGFIAYPKPFDAAIANGHKVIRHDATNLPEAVAALFVMACEDGLIDPKTVVLP